MHQISMEAMLAILQAPAEPDPRDIMLAWRARATFEHSMLLERPALMPAARCQKSTLFRSNRAASPLKVFSARRQAVGRYRQINNLRHQVRRS